MEGRNRIAQPATANSCNNLISYSQRILHTTISD